MLRRNGRTVALPGNDSSIHDKDRSTSVEVARTIIITRKKSNSNHYRYEE